MNLRLIVFTFVGLFGLFLSLPSLSSIAGPKINLGLDLQGGLTLLLDVKTQEVVQSKYKTLATTLSFEAKEEKILLKGVQALEDALHFEILDTDEKQKMDAIIAHANPIELG